MDLKIDYDLELATPELCILLYFRYIDSIFQECDYLSVKTIWY